MSVALVVFTDGRMRCLDRTLESITENLTGTISRWIVIDDSADWATGAALDYALDTWEIHHAPNRRGFAGTIGYAWELLREMDDVDYVCHWEDDFVLTEPVNLDHLTAVMDREPILDQMALLRQPWNATEIAAGGVMETNTDAFTERDGWVEHSLFFTTNPSVYRWSLCHVGWPQCDQSEGIFTAERRAIGRRFGYWGERGHEYVEHIGTERVGTGY